MDTLIRDIKFNCDVSDAKYWGYFSVCGLLMRYRDLFRSEMGLKAWSEVPHDEIIGWIRAKESRWPDLERAEFHDLNINGTTYNPFDIEGINRAIKDQGLLYGAGYGMFMKPTFFLADLTSQKVIDNLTASTTKKEYARDLFASPGMLQGENIIIRFEPLETILWDKYSGLGSKSTVTGDSLKSCTITHRFARDIDEHTLVEQMAELSTRYADFLLLHEIAEFREGIPEWAELLTQAGTREAEQYLRTIKDLIADTSESGPLKKIITAQDRESLTLAIELRESFFGVFYPELGEAFQQLLKTNDWAIIEQTRRKGYEKFVAERQKVLELRAKTTTETFSHELNRIITEKVNAGK